ncbi:MAG: sterol desaturase family protein [Candidatus Binatia bacterium]
MNAPPELFPTAAIVLVTLALASVMEVVVPMVERPAAHRGRRAANLGLTATTVVLNWALSAAAAGASLVMAGNGTGLMTELGIPRASQIVVGFLLIDFAFGYVAHRLMHRSSMLWRVHRVHHSDPFVDATTTFRNHPVEGVWRWAWSLVPVLALGVPAEAVVLHRMITVLNGSLAHANIRLWPPLERVLSSVWVTPAMHKVHHSRERVETNSNFGAILAIHDRLFGTFTPTDRARGVVYGLDDMDPDRAASLRELLAMPFRREAA